MASVSSSSPAPLGCLRRANNAVPGSHLVVSLMTPMTAFAKYRVQHSSLNAHSPALNSNDCGLRKKKTFKMIVEAQAGRKVKEARRKVVLDPDYRIPIVLLGGAGALVYNENLLAAAPLGILGLLLLIQTTRVRFVFDAEALEVKIGDQLQESGENVFVGGKNRWKYSSFVNWELWWPKFPILVYFKESQTIPEGQVHFFPVIFNGKQLYDLLVERAGPSQNSLPK